MKKGALIGQCVSDSLSPHIHAFIAKRLNLDIEYENVSVPVSDFDNRINDLIDIYDGLNITIPYKLAIISRLKKLYGDAELFGSVNTVDCRERVGYNTDGLGFMLMLQDGGVDVRGKKVLVLGAGGAGRSVCKKLLDGGAKVYLYNRHIEKAVAVANKFKGIRAVKKLKNKSYYLIVNATGVGMHETAGLSPVDGELFKKCTVAADLIYVPPKSKFLSLAEEAGKQIINGFAMLFYQAYYSDCIFFKMQSDEGLAKKLYAEYLTEVKNEASFYKRG